MRLSSPTMCQIFCDLLGIEKGTLSLTLQELEIFADSHMLKEHLQK